MREVQDDRINAAIAVAEAQNALTDAFKAISFYNGYEDADLRTQYKSLYKSVGDLRTYIKKEEPVGL